MDEPPSQSLIIAILSGPGLTYAFTIAALAVLVFVSAIVSASEIAFFSLKPDDVEQCSSSENPKDKIIVGLLRDPRRLLATILIMSNLVNVGIITIATFTLWKLTGTHQPTIIIIGIATFIITFAITFFTEIIPKVYATEKNITIARYTATAWVVFVALCWPLSSLLIAFSSVIEKRFKQQGYSATVEELNQALEIATQSTDTTEDEKEILKGIMNFGTLTVRQVMRSRLDISAADVTMSFHELMDFINKSGFSRVPVYRESIDKIEGVLYIKDLLPFIDQNENFEWQLLLRRGFFVPDNKKIDVLLKDFQEKHVHMALVIDEYGGVSGLITLEDIIEEIIGDINDEFDEDLLNYHQINDSTFVFEGKTSLHHFCKALDIEPNTFDDVRGDSESLGGLILELNNELPNAGKKITYKNFTFFVEAVDKKRIKRVRVHIHEEKESL